VGPPDPSDLPDLPDPPDLPDLSDLPDLPGPPDLSARTSFRRAAHSTTGATAQCLTSSPAVAR
jgi:hypothetical protein